MVYLWRAVDAEGASSRRPPSPQTYDEAGGVIGMGCAEAKSGQAAKRPMAETSGASLPRDVSVLSTVTGLEGRDLDGLRRQWRAHLGGEAPAHLPRWLLMRVLAYRLQSDAFGDLDKAVGIDQIHHEVMGMRLPSSRDHQTSATSSGVLDFRTKLSRAASELVSIVGESHVDNLRHRGDAGAHRTDARRARRRRSRRQSAR